MGTKSSDVSVSLQQYVSENDKQDQLCGISVREGSGVTEARVGSQSTWGIIQEMFQSLKPNSEKIQAV